MKTMTRMQLPNDVVNKNACFPCGDGSITGLLESDSCELKGSLLDDAVILGVTLEK